MRWLFSAVGIGVFVLLTIAASDRLFLRTVPLEQRLISANEDIRKKAQQELLGLDVGPKRDLTSRLLPSLSAEDPFVRKWTAIALALMGSAAQEAIPALLRGVMDPRQDVAQAYRVALSEIGTPDPSQLPTLLQSLQDPHEAVRCEAAAGLSRMGPAAKEGLSLLISQLKSPEASECMQEATARLAGLIPESLPDLLSLLKDPSAPVRRRAAHVLSMLSAKTPETWIALCDVLANDDDGRVRWITARALTLRRPPDRGHVPTLSALALHAKETVVRQTALSQLTRAAWSTEDQRRVLSRILTRDPNADLRWAAAQGLAAHAPESRAALEPLMEALQDDDVRVRRTALLALRSMPVHGRGVAAAVGRLQHDPDATIRCLAAEKLIDMSDWSRVSVKTLTDDLASESDESCAGEALVMEGRFNPDVVPALMRLLRGGAFETRRRSVSVLMQLGGRATDALPLLAQAQRDGIPGSLAAIRAVGESRPASTRRRHRS